jgi:hypothetical protein
MDGRVKKGLFINFTFYNPKITKTTDFQIEIETV